MKKWLHRLKQIPRKMRIALYLLAILCMGFLLYLFIGSPALNWQHGYRRIERAHLVGPGEILGRESVSGSFFGEVVVAKTESGVILTPLSMHMEDYGLFLYLPQKGRITVSAAPQILTPSEIDFSMDTLTVFVVHDYPEAAKVELDLELYWQQRLEVEAVRPVFHLSAQREKEGYFRLDVPLERLEEDSPERMALELFSKYTRTITQWRDEWHIPEDAYNSTVRLYDSANNLITEQTVKLFD